MSGMGANSQVQATDQAIVLQSVVNVLRATVPVLATEATCFVSNADGASVDVQDNVFCTVEPGNGEFQQNAVVGGGPAGIHETSQLTVKVYSRIGLDQQQRAQIALLDADRGLLPLKKAVLSALAGRQLFRDYPTNTVPLLTQHLTPRRAITGTSRQSDDDFVYVSITFDAAFEWDLTS